MCDYVIKEIHSEADITDDLRTYYKTYYNSEIYYNDAIRVFILLHDTVIISLCYIKNTTCYTDKKDKYLNKHSIKLNDKLLKNFANNFTPITITCLYNLTRLPNACYKGCGIYFLDEILKLLGTIHLATIHLKLLQYYKLNGYCYTSYFDIDDNGIMRKILNKKIIS